MSVTLESFGLESLSREEKLSLAGQLWDSVVASEPAGSLLSDEQRTELHRRIADAQAHPGDYVMWKDALAGTLKRLSP
jgi:putative addiction module component (TIGR02574 family)